MRSKEGSSDYRYFPEPDLPPILVSVSQRQAWQAELPELPAQKRHRYEEDLGLSAYDARVLSDEASIAAYFEATVAAGADPKLAANWITQDMAAYLNTEKKEIADLPLTPSALAELVQLIAAGTISNKIGKDLLPELLAQGGSPREMVEKRGLSQISDPAQIAALIDEVLAAHPEELAAYRGGKTKLQGFFVGQLMKQSGGRVDPKLSNQLLSQKLKG
jgi:aspartyl-tRNA(Asn)/glutamyl-tRNA(Gln) amidotransferase subunit B